MRPPRHVMALRVPILLALLCLAWTISLQLQLLEDVSSRHATNEDLHHLHPLHQHNNQHTQNMLFMENMTIDESRLVRKNITNSTGRILVFYHLYKTGGSTIRDLAQQYVRRSSSSAGRVVVFRRLEVDFFTMTLLREPVAFALSFFNYFYIHKREDWNPFHTANATEQDFLKTIVPNRQCRMLASHPLGLSPNDTRWDSCDYTQVSSTLLDTMDWIGTTEDLSTQTLPLLAHFVTGQFTSNITKKPKNVLAKKAKTSLLQQLSLETIDRVQTISQFDAQLYHLVQQTYTKEYSKIWMQGIAQNDPLRFVRRQRLRACRRRRATPNCSLLSP